MKKYIVVTCLVFLGLKVSENAQGKRINELIKSKNQSLQLFENRIKPNQDQLIMKNTKQPNPRRQNGLFRGALMQRICTLLCLALTSVTAMAEETSSKGTGNAAELEALQSDFIELRLGMFLHYNMGTYTQRTWSPPNDDPKRFAPTKLDCRQWAKAAKSAGMKFAILTTKHHDGFCLWDSAVTTYDVASSSYPHDVVKQYADAFRAEGLKVGLYYSIWDRTEGIDGNTTPKQIDFIKAQLTELLTNYGKIDILMTDGWFWKMGMNDMPYTEIREHIRKLQPNCLFTEHSHLSDLYRVDVVNFEGPFGGFPPEDNKIPGLLSEILSGSWFWNEETKCVPVSRLVKKLKELESRYCNYYINCSPNPDGLLDDNEVKRLGELGKSWTPDTNRPPLPSQDHQLIYPVVAAKITADSGDAELLYDARMIGPIQKNWISAPDFPQAINIDLGAIYSGLELFGVVPNTRCKPTPEMALKEGNVTEYKLSVSEDGKSFQEISQGKWEANAKMKIAKFAACSGRYLKFEILAANGNNAIINELEIGGVTAAPIAQSDVVLKKTFHKADIGEEDSRLLSNE
jgi:alpha-L-fucosidase